MVYSFHKLAEERLEAAGKDIGHITGPIQLIDEAMTGSDLPILVAATANKKMMEGYNYFGDYWKPFVKTRMVKDFKLLTSIRLTDIGDLIQIPGVSETAAVGGAPTAPGGEAIRFGTRDQEVVTYNVNLWGRRIEYLLSLLVNDDMDALADTVFALGRSCNRTIATDIFAIFVNNPNYEPDGVPIFNAAHANTQALALNAANLATALTLLMSQTDTNGNAIEISRWHLVVPQALGYTANQLWEQAGGRIAADAAPITPLKTLGMQPPTIAPALTALSGTCWFLVADPGDIVSIEVAYLRGIENPIFLTTRGHWQESILGQYVGQNFSSENAALWAWGYDCLDYRGLVQGNT